MESTQKPVDRDAAEEAAEPRRRAAANPATRRAPVARRVPVDPAGTAAAPAADANDEVAGRRGSRRSRRSGRPVSRFWKRGGPCVTRRSGS